MFVALTCAQQWARVDSDAVSWAHADIGTNDAIPLDSEPRLMGHSNDHHALLYRGIDYRPLQQGQLT